MYIIPKSYEAAKRLLHISLQGQRSLVNGHVYTVSPNFGPGHPRHFLLFENFTIISALSFLLNVNCHIFTACGANHLGWCILL